MNLRSTGLLLLLPSEGLLLGLLFDAESLASLPSGWWSPVGRIAPSALPIATAVATSGLLLAGPRIHEQCKDRSWAPPGPGRVYGFLAAHLLALGALVALTSALFAGRPAGGSVGMEVAAWLAAAALTAIFWAAAVIPPGAVRVVVREAWPVLLAGVACGLLAWGAGEYTQHFLAPLRRATLLVAAWLLGAVDATAWCNPTGYVLGAGGFAVRVSYQCSGYEGIGLTWIALGAWLVLYRRHLRLVPVLLLLLPAATLAVWLANAGRIAALVFVGAHWSEEVGLGGFHSYVGALLFSGVVLGAAWTGWRSPWFSREVVRQPAGGRNPAAPYLVPILAMTAAALVAGLFTREPANALYPVQVAAGLGALWLYRHEARGAGWSLSPVPVVAGAVVAILWVVLAGTFDDPSFHATAVGPAWRLPWLACRMLGAVVVVPIVEELAFRGYLARRLMASDFAEVPLSALSWPAVVVSSVVFGALHSGFVAGTTAGVCYALVARYRGRLTDAIVAHGVTNALLAAAAMASQFRN